MPYTKAEREVLEAMQREYGSKKGKSVFYASINKGKLGAASKRRHGAKKK